MSLRQHVKDFEGDVMGIASHAPDRYNEKLISTFESDKEFLFEDWNKVKSLIGIDVGIVKEIDDLIQDGLNQLHHGDKEQGRDIFWIIHNQKIDELKEHIKSKKNVR